MPRREPDPPLHADDLETDRAVTEEDTELRTSTASSLALWSNVIEADAELSEARYEISAALHLAGYGPELIGDINLIITEFSVDALTHGGTDTVEIDIERVADNSTVVIRMAHHEDVSRFRVADPPVMPGTDETAGRGRAIVAALSDEFITSRHPPSRIEHLVVIRT